MALLADGTLLHEAAWGGQTETVKTLFRLGAKPDTEDGKGKAPLHVSAESGSKVHGRMSRNFPKY